MSEPGSKEAFLAAAFIFSMGLLVGGLVTAVGFLI